MISAGTTASDARFKASTVRQRRKPGEKVLRPTRPNVGIEVAYRKRLDALIAEMAASVEYFVKAAYRANEPAALAQDESSADAIQRAMRKLVRRWTGRFDEMSGRLADWFAQSVERRSSDALRKILKDGGFTVEFQMTPAMRDITAATVNANVSLIRSVPRQYLASIESAVMRSVQTGRDLGGLAKDLQHQLGVTRRRAALIARTQNNLATAAFTRARRLEVGITEAIWAHSSGGREPRPSHVKAGRDQVRFDVAQGWFDPDEKKWIQPGELINCKCFSRPIVRGFS